MALVTTGIVSSLAAFSGAVLFQHYVQRTPEADVPIAVVDMVQIGAEVTKLAAKGTDSQYLLEASGKRLGALNDAGYLVIDARSVIYAPPRFKVPVSALVPGASDTPNPFSGYVPPTPIREGADDAPSSNATFDFLKGH